MLEAIETHCSETLCRSLWTCSFVSASFGGIASRDIFLATVLLLVSAYLPVKASRRT